MYKMLESFRDEKFNIKAKVAILTFLLALIISVIIYNLFDLQIVKGNENLYLSSSAKMSESIVLAPRGLIYDRNGKILVKNKPSYRLVMNLLLLPKEKEEQVLNVLSSILGIEPQVFKDDFRAKAYIPATDIRVNYSNITLLRDIDRDKIVSILSRNDELPGVFVDVSTTREYIDGKNMAHILGYIREVSGEEIESGKYASGDLIGASGLELFYDNTLRGQNGRMYLETTRDDIKIREFSPVEPISGNSIQLTIDQAIQDKLTEFLARGIERTGSSGGASIIVNIENGEILAIVSLPSFDPNSIVKGLSLSEYNSLTQDESLPLYNRAISLAQPPGSTFKTIVASAALQEGVITPSTVFESTGCMDLGGGYDFCEVGKRPYGSLDLYHGMSRSSNIYFCNTMLKLGIDKLNFYTEQFNLGSKTGIDLFGEESGTMASKQVKFEKEGVEWYSGDSCNTAIGQGYTRISPIQMVMWTSSIANGGTYYKPRIVKGVVDENFNFEKQYDKEVLHELMISDENLDVVKKGMYLVVNDPWGSAFPLRNLKSDPAAKTGSAQAWRKVNGVYVEQAHSWITGFFPYSKPKYAFVVFLEHGGWGFQSAQVMKDFLNWYDTEYSQ